MTGNGYLGPADVDYAQGSVVNVEGSVNGRVAAYSCSAVSTRLALWMMTGLFGTSP